MSGGYSYNGWPASDDSSAIGVNRGFEVDGVTFPGGCKSGDVETVFRYLVEQLDGIEPLVPGWCWGYEYRANVNNPSSLSCHASATALDYNAPDHPNGGPAYGGWTDDQVDQIRDLLDYLGGVVDWGADFSGTKDPMHFEISGDAADVARVATMIRNQEDDDMALSPEDKDWISDTVTNAINKALRVDTYIVTNDRASTPNDVPYSFETGMERLIRLTSGTFVGETGKPHDD
jgi:hypothetical protein